MVDMSAETFAKNCIHTISQLKRGKESALWKRIKDTGRELDVKNIFDLIDKDLRANLKLIIPQKNKLEIIKDMDQNLLKTSNLCILMNAL